MAGVSTELQRR